jgi:hypothetical protein
VVKEQTIPPTNSVAPKEIEAVITSMHEIKDPINVNQSNTNNNFGETTETTPDLTSEAPNDDISNNDISHLEDKNYNENTIKINVDTCDDDDVLFYDAVTAIDASANSSDVLLNNDDNFLQDLKEYTITDVINK